MTRDELQDIIRVLSEMPGFTLEYANALSAEELKRKPSDIHFSLTEQVWHLRDIEEFGYAVRIQKLLTEEYPLLSDINGAKLAVERAYNTLDFAEGQRGFSRARLANIESLRRLTPEQLSRRGRFDNSADITFQDLIQMMRDHDAGHRSEIIQFFKPSNRSAAN